MKCLLTGSTGFLGTSLIMKWYNLPVLITGLARSDADLICDLYYDVPVFDSPFDTVIHAAGLAHRKASDQEFYQVNYQGTKNLLKGLEGNLPKKIIFISSILVYGLESGSLIDENTPCHPTTAYGESKLMAEQAVRNWAEEKGVKALILRLPLVNGENPPGNLGAMREAMKKGRYFRIGKGNARKSWVQATEIAEFILNNPDLEGTYNLTSANHPTLAEIENQIAQELNLPEPKSIPYGMAWLAAHTFGLLPGFPLSLARFRKLTAELTFRSQVTGH
jgi:nucleoside-diphosphate-sugar epimerase